MYNQDKKLSVSKEIVDVFLTKDVKEGLATFSRYYKQSPDAFEHMYKERYENRVLVFVQEYDDVPYKFTLVERRAYHNYIDGKYKNPHGYRNNGMIVVLDEFDSKRFLYAIYLSMQKGTFTTTKKKWVDFLQNEVEKSNYPQPNKPSYEFGGDPIEKMRIRGWN